MEVKGDEVRGRGRSCEKHGVISKTSKCSTGQGKGTSVWYNGTLMQWGQDTEERNGTCDDGEMPETNRDEAATLRGSWAEEDEDPRVEEKRREKQENGVEK